MNDLTETSRPSQAQLNLGSIIGQTINIVTEMRDAERYTLSSMAILLDELLTGDKLHDEQRRALSLCKGLLETVNDRNDTPADQMAGVAMISVELGRLQITQSSHYREMVALALKAESSRIEGGERSSEARRPAWFAAAIKIVQQTRARDPYKETAALAQIIEGELQPASGDGRKILIDSITKQLRRWENDGLIPRRATRPRLRG